MVFTSIADFTHLTENQVSRGNKAVKVRNEWNLSYSLRISTGWYLPTAKRHCNKDNSSSHRSWKSKETAHIV